MKPVHTVHFDISVRGLTPVFHCYAHKGDPFCRADETCAFISWMSARDVGIGYYDGEPTRARAGMIIPEWRGDFWQWRYPKPGEIYR